MVGRRPRRYRGRSFRVCARHPRPSSHGVVAAADVEREVAGSCFSCCARTSSIKSRSPPRWFARWSARAGHTRARRPPACLKNQCSASAVWASVGGVRVSSRLRIRVARQPRALRAVALIAGCFLAEARRVLERVVDVDRDPVALLGALGGPVGLRLVGDDGLGLGSSCSGTFDARPVATPFSISSALTRGSSTIG